MGYDTVVIDRNARVGCQRGGRPEGLLGGVSGLGESVTSRHHGPVIARHAGRIAQRQSEAMAISKALRFL